MIHMLSPEILFRASRDATIFPAELVWVLWEVWWNRSSTQLHVPQHRQSTLRSLVE
jgi:hypothetical protein